MSAAGCRHRRTEHGDPLGFDGCPAGPKCNWPEAHGASLARETCGDCGSGRDVAANGGRRCCGPWEPMGADELRPLYVALAAAEARRRVATEEWEPAKERSEGCTTETSAGRWRLKRRAYYESCLGHAEDAYDDAVEAVREWEAGSRD